MKKIRVVAGAAVSAALFCGCAAAGAGNTTETARADKQEAAAALSQENKQEAAAALPQENRQEAAAPGENEQAADGEMVLPEKIEIRTEGDYPYDAEEIMYLSGVRMTAYRQGTRYSLCDLDGDGVSELFIAAAGSAAADSTAVAGSAAADSTAVTGSAAADSAAAAGGAAESSAAADSAAAEVTGIYYYDAEQNAAILRKTWQGDAETGAKTGTETGTGDSTNSSTEDSVPNSTLPYDLIWVEGAGWPDASLTGVAEVLGDPGVRTDFYLSANHEWLSGQHVHGQGEIVDRFSETQKVPDRKREMFSDRDRYTGDDIRILRDYYDAAADWERRDREGIEPVRKYLAAIEDIHSIPELTEYLTDPETDPFCIFMTLNTSLDLEDTSSWILELGEDRFSVLPRIYHNSDPEEIEAVREDFVIPVRHLLSKGGFQEAEIDRLLKETFALEDRLLERAWGQEEEQGREAGQGEKEENRFGGCLPFDEFVSGCRHFPLKEVLNAYGVNGGRVRAVYPQYLELLDEIYTEDDLPELKAYLLTHTAYSAYPYLDLETAGCLIRGEETEEEFRESMNETYRGEVLSSRGLLGVAAENAYMTYFADDADKQDIIALCEEIRDAFREMLGHSDWLSPEGRKRAAAKLDSMTFSVLKPDRLIDSSYLAVDREACFLDNYARILVNSTRHNCALAGTERVPGDWCYDIRHEIATTTENAFYYGSFNQFFILSGFVNEATYRKDMPVEEKLGRLGAVIGHELTHGFDPLGIQYDQHGNKVVTDERPYGWLPEEDFKAFMERAGQIAAYYDAIKSFPYAACDGERVWGEAAADIGGMAICLKIAENCPDFDYDRFFRSYAELWRMQSTLSTERYDVSNEHPLRYLRINTVVQQFDEFLDTYGVQKGDLMYLAPEDRIDLWTERVPGSGTE